MMGRKQFAPRLFHTLSLEAMVPADHRLRRLEAVLDLSSVQKLCSPYYSPTGQPSIDPVVLFKIMLLGYLYGITSERRLAEECSLHLAFRWYLGYDLDEATPDHSVLSKARIRYGPQVFEAFFQRVLKLCLEAGLVGGKKLFADSTLVAANASMKSLVAREPVFQPLRTPGEHLDQVFAENPGTSESDREGTSSQQTTSVSAPEAATRISSPDSTEEASSAPPDSRPRGRKPGRRVTLNRQRVSRTDPEASIHSRPGLGTLLAYKEHFTVDSHHRVVTAVEVTPAETDDSEPVLRLLDQQPLRPQEFCADSHYGIPKVYAELRRRGILAAVPRRSPQSRKPKAGRLPISAFTYVPERDVYLCPQGRELKRVAYEQRWDRYHYRPRQRDCHDCSLRLACSTRKTIRTIIHYPQYKTLQWAEAHLASPQGQQIFAQRRVMAEWVVAEAKGFHGLKRALHRGLKKFKIQALLIATVQNLKRLMAATTLAPNAPPLLKLYLIPQLQFAPA